MVTDGNIREQPLSRKGRRLFYTLYLSPRFSRAGKTQIFSFDKNYLSRPVMLWAPSEMAAGGPFYFSPFLLPCVHGWRRTNHRKERPLAWRPAPAAGLHLPADSSHYVLAPAAGRPAPSAALPPVSAPKENAARNYHNGYHRRRSACRLIKGA